MCPGVKGKGPKMPKGVLKRPYWPFIFKKLFTALYSLVLCVSSVLH